MKRTALILLAGLLFAASASAATMVNTWSFINDANFVAATDTAGKVVGDAGAEVFISPDGNTLSWGEPSSTGGSGERSSLVLGAPVGGSLTTNGPMELAATITHFNYVISSTVASLASGKAEVSLSLTPTDPAGAALPTFTETLEFMFYETVNTSDPEVSKDIFLLVDPTAITRTFDYNGYSYTFTFGGDAFSEITGPADALLDSTLGDGTYYGWTTYENQSNIGQFTVMITAEPIATPEPATLLLLGAGLFGLGVAVRRRHN